VYFISYARSDQDFALQLAEDLASAGYRVWLDQLVLRPSDVWERQIELALEESSTVVVVITSASIESMNVLAEINYALELNKPLIPILADDCKIPFRLRTIQSIDFRADYKTAFHRLLRSLGRREDVKSGTPDGDAARPNSPRLHGNKSDRQVRSAPSGNLPQQLGKAPQELCETKPQIEFDFLQTCFEQPQFRQKVQVDPNIDAEMLRNAVRSMSISPAMRIRALIDLTVFGSAKEALVFGDAGLLFIDRQSQKTTELHYSRLKSCKFRHYDAPFVSKHVSIVELTVADREEYRFGVAGGPMSGQELVQLLTELSNSASNAA
jgi:hypothetical protein